MGAMYKPRMQSKTERTTKKQAMSSKSWCQFKSEKSKINLSRYKTDKVVQQEIDGGEISDDLPDLDDDSDLTIVSANFSYGSDSDCILVEQISSDHNTTLTSLDISQDDNVPNSIKQQPCIIKSEVTSQSDDEEERFLSRVRKKRKNNLFSDDSLYELSPQLSMDISPPSSIPCSPVHETTIRMEASKKLNNITQSPNPRADTQVDKTSTPKKAFVFSQKAKENLSFIFKATQENLKKMKSDTTVSMESSAQSDTSSERHFYDIFDDKEKAHFNSGTLGQDSEVESTDADECSNNDSRTEPQLDKKVPSIFTDKTKALSAKLLKPMALHFPLNYLQKQNSAPVQSHGDVNVSPISSRESSPVILNGNTKDFSPSLLQAKVKLTDVAKLLKLNRTISSPSPSKIPKIGHNDSTIWRQRPQEEVTKELVFNLQHMRSTSLDSVNQPGRLIKVARMSRSEDTSLTDNTQNQLELCDWQRLKSVVEGPPDEQIDSVISGFSDVHIDTVSACFEEDSTDFLAHGLQLVHDFSVKYSPSPELVQQVFQKTLIQGETISVVSQGYKTLRFLHHKFPGLVEIQFSILTDMMDKLNLGQTYSKQDKIKLYKVNKVLQLSVLLYHSELYHKDIIDTRGIRQSLVYKNMAYDSSQGSNNLKLLLNWIICCLTFGEFENTEMYENPEVLDQLGSGRSREDQKVSVRHQELIKILPNLQKLVEISINVSSSCVDAAKFCASELLKNFIYLAPNYKKLLLRTMESSLLRFRLVTLVLENYCEETIPCCEFPREIQQVLNCYMEAEPPRVIYTPPTTPQSEEDGEGARVHPRELPLHSPASVEELAMLQYYCLLSYLQYIKDKSNMPLRIRTRYKKMEFGCYSRADEEELNVLSENVDTLQQHLKSLTADLTPDTERYLLLMCCLGESK